MSLVTYDGKGLQRGTCNKLSHAPCQRVGESLYDYHSNSSCLRHCTNNNSTNSSQDPHSVMSENRISILGSSTDNSYFNPASASASIPSKTKSTSMPFNPNSPLKNALIKFQSSREKKPQLPALLILTSLALLFAQKPGSHLTCMTVNISPLRLVSPIRHKKRGRSDHSC